MLRAEMLAVFLIIGGLIPRIHTEDFRLSIVPGNDKVMTGRFLNSLLLSFPPCSYAGQNVDLEYMNCDTNQIYVLNHAFTVPSCNSSGDVKGSTAFRPKFGYRLMNLTSGTQYKITYKIGNFTSTVVETTRAAANYNSISLGYQGRSASMLVITVILSVTMFVLLVCISIGVFVTPS